MQLRYEIPDTFWSLFRSVNREIYMESLLVINEEYQYSNYFLTKEICVQVLSDMNAQKQVLLQREENETDFDMLETTASRILRWLLKTGWLKKIEDYSTMTTNIVIPDYAAVFIEAFERLTSEELEETELYIQNVYATLFSFQNNSRVNLNMLRTALINTRKLNKALQAVHDNIGWDEKYPVRDMGNGKVRAVGMGMAMQGSGITSVDVGSASLKINDDGFYTLSIGAADMGTGCDTILAQIAAEVLECPLDNVTVLGADTDSSPYDSGSYASSTTYVTGKAVEQCAEQLKQKICQVGAGLLGLDERAVVFAGDAVTSEDGTQRATLAQIAAASQCGSNTALEAVVTHSSEISPPPFMVGAAEVEVDLETGEAQVIRYEAAVDCGTPVNPNLARVQAEGGILQGIGMALTENVTYDDRGMPQENSLMQYKIPARNDIGHIHVVFESSYEGTGPFGAKSIGEVVINTPLPAVADAIYHATHKRFYELPITREQIALAGQ